MIKGVTILCVLSFLILTSESKLLAQATTKEITDTFFALYSKGSAKAVDYAFSTNKWMLTKQDVITNVKTQLKTMVDLLGDYSGNNLISDNAISPDFRVVKYLVKYSREPLMFTFLFYKPKDKWVVLNFSWKENMDKEIEDAGKGK